jgi:acyl-CoA reductase-like NAD-dependent aldehyde dehydrogenase
MLIGGKRVDAVSGKTFKVVNPATGEEFAEAPLGDRRGFIRYLRGKTHLLLIPWGR